jgi:hypothetical protein
MGSKHFPAFCFSGAASHHAVTPTEKKQETRIGTPFPSPYRLRGFVFLGMKSKSVQSSDNRWQRHTPTIEPFLAQVWFTEERSKGGGQGGQDSNVIERLIQGVIGYQSYRGSTENEVTNYQQGKLEATSWLLATITKD